ncbi:hypothetical protein DSO57_1016560 [Entomophthora muscae]|uniref:Uncharacterized protein n=1 Tax=Entomophthora muscae TaxID=34485 RepID=A0ACC2S6N7_9FUNG|nr:hypothetical protein DSO57_1016560 [Entomophthora muscae]
MTSPSSQSLAITQDHFGDWWTGTPHRLLPLHLLLLHLLSLPPSTLIFNSPQVLK